MPKRMHNVATKSRDKNKLTIIISDEERVRLRKAASRQAQIDAGMVSRSGAGGHGGNHRTANRRERQQAKQQIRSGRFE